jgi:D-threo-aldose 1-dehydrogenase
VACVLTGVSSAAELRENAALLRTPVDGALWDELRDAELLPADAPTPR